MRRPRKAPAVDLSVPCDVWTGGRQSEGYGITRHPVTRQPVLVHRLAWELAVAPLRTDEHLHHRCRNRVCRELRHIVVTTASEHNAIEAAERTHCRRGHPRTAQNIKRTTWGGRQAVRCRICIANNATKLTQRRRAARAA